MYPMNMGMGQQPGPGNQQIPAYGPQNVPGMQQGLVPGFNPTRQQVGLIVRPVASYDEAIAVPTDFMGNILVLTDFSHGKIYTKVLDQATGSPVFRSYTKDPDPELMAQQTQTQPTEPAAQPYDAKSEIDTLKAELLHIKQELGIDKEETA